MHLYLDESYGPNAYVQAALVVYDRGSQRAIRRTVTQTVVRLKEHLKDIAPSRFAGLPGGRIVELKGAASRGKKCYIPGLNDYPELRNEFFHALVNEADFRVVVLYFDRPEVMKWMPKREERRYGRLLQNLIATVDLVPPKARFFGITIDSQNAALPTQEGGKLYTWRKRRPAQRRQRIADKTRHRRWIQQIDALLRARYPGAKTNMKIWLVPSHLDTCLQAADVIANFSYRYHRLGLRLPPQWYVEVPRGKKEWFEGYHILAPRVWWIHNRRLGKPKHFVSTEKLPVDNSGDLHPSRPRWL